MVAEPKLVDAPDILWRVGRTTEPLHFSAIAPEDAASENGGNRFDVPGGRVLYAASSPEGAFAETLARFRPTAAMRALPPEEDEHFMVPGAIPADWRTRRQLSTFTLSEPLPFLDVDSPETHTHLTQTMAGVLETLAIPHLDVAIMRGSNRFITRAVSAHAYVAQDEDGNAKYSGLRYGSRLGSWECWAIFEGTHIGASRQVAIGKTDAALEKIARSFDLTIH
ncbi:MAG: RES family NAD+ phosphorylase [Rhodoglobus sp.]